MEQAFRPHRGGTVLAVGILSLVAAFFLIPLGIVAWIMGSRDLKGMKRGEVEPAGRSLTRIGWVFGIASSVLWLATASVSLMMMRETQSVYDLDATGAARIAKVGFATGPFVRSPPRDVFEYEYREIIRPDGEWVKEGPFVRRARNGQKLEEGVYRDGRREGAWTFWNEDGSIDAPRSGVYEADARVSASAPSPPGDS